MYFSGLGSVLPTGGFTEFTGFYIHNEFMDVGELSVIPTMLVSKGRHVSVEKHGGLFDGDGTRRLQQRVQGGVLASDGKDASIQPAQEAFLLRSLRHGIPQQLQSRGVFQEFVFQDFTEFRLFLRGGKRCGNGTDFFIARAVKESVNVFREARRFSPAAYGGCSRSPASSDYIFIRRRRSRALRAASWPYSHKG